MLTGVGGNAVGAFVVFFYLVVFSSVPIAPERRHVLIVIFLAYVIPALYFGNRIFITINRPLYEAIERNEPIVGVARRALFATPWRVALASYIGWTGAAVLFATLDGTLGRDSTFNAFRLGLAIHLGGLTTLAVTFLLNERALRPGFALAFADQPPERSLGLNVWPRLVLSWLLGSAVPLVAIALAFAGQGPREFTRIRGLVLVLVGVSLWAGAAITRRTARAVAEPLHELRAAMARVQSADLGAVVPVDDASEIGLMQVGFNEMVRGLRERAQLEDLFGRHVGVDVARQALEHGVQLGGEVRNVSALFVDLIGSTRLAATRPAHEVVEILNALFGAVVRVSATEHGWVNKFEGDAALCVFGAPVEDPHHATHALRAARALRAELSWLGGKYGVDAGIGVASGDAVAGNVGAEDRYEYTVIGDPVNEAARLTEAAKQNASRVLVNGGAYQQADDEERKYWRPCGTLTLRGRTEPTHAYEPVPG
jgi:adenylate cyclase